MAEQVPPPIEQVFDLPPPPNQLSFLLLLVCKIFAVQSLAEVYAAKIVVLKFGAVEKRSEVVHSNTE